MLAYRQLHCWKCLGLFWKLEDICPTYVNMVGISRFWWYQLFQGMSCKDSRRKQSGALDGHMTGTKIFLLFNRYLTSPIEAICDANWVDPPFYELLSLLQQGTSKDDYTCRTISNLVVLWFGQLYKQSCNLMFNIHLGQDSCAVIRDRDITIWRYEYFIKSSRSLENF